MVKTIILTGAETAVSSSGRFFNIKNSGSGTMYASAAPNVVADADGVMPIDAGTSVIMDTSAADTVYLLGTGKAVYISKDTDTDFFNSAAAAGGEDTVARSKIDAHERNDEIHVTAEEKAAWNAVNYSNPNLLINPDFRINQRGASGTITDVGYFVDRWKLVSGEVTINTDGTLTLNGSISQTLENAAGTDVTASASAGTAVYDNSTKTFTLTAAGETISWAKLEVGSIATKFSPPDTAAELLKCQRYLWVLRGNLLRSGISLAPNEHFALFFLYAPAAFRTTPTVSYENLVLVQSVNGNLTNEIELLQIKSYTSNVVKLYVKTNTASPLAVGTLYELTNMSGTAGALIFDAEI